jgi:hypothetical protein
MEPQNVSLIASAGTTASLPAGATATGIINADDHRSRVIEIEAKWTHGASPNGNVTIAIYRSIDGAAWATTPEYNYSVTYQASATMTEVLPPAVSRGHLKVAITNGDSVSAVTNVTLRYREVN